MMHCVTILVTLWMYCMDTTDSRVVTAIEKFTTAQLGIRDLCLTAHNRVRALHVRTAPLQWDWQLAKSAHNYALHLAETHTFVHSGAPQVGENLFEKSINFPGVQYTPADAVHAWYIELEDYNTCRPTDTDKKTGHYTQLLWRESTRVGCGAASYRYDDVINGRQVSLYKTLIVAHYSPRGNYWCAETLLNNVMPTVPGWKMPKIDDLEINAMVDKSPLCAQYAGYCLTAPSVTCNACRSTCHAYHVCH